MRKIVAICIISLLFNGTLCFSLTSVFSTALPVFRNSDSLQLYENVDDSLSVNYWRVGITTATAASTLGGTYVFLQNAWWKEISQGFHFDQGRDLKYARNMDKVAHFMGGMITADIFHGMLRWSHVPEKKSYLYGALFGTFVQGAIEIKDGYAPRWGFSVLDVTVGACGSLYPLAKHYVPFFSNIDFKFSYFRRHNTYFDFNPNGSWIDDYINQTYWISFHKKTFLAEETAKFWPSWLALSGGISIDETTDGKGGGRVEFFLAPDLDFIKIIPQHTRFLRIVSRAANYIKFPAPTIRLSPALKGYWLFF